MTNDGLHTYTYDAENRIIRVDGGSTATYTYDGDSRRVRKVAGYTTTDDLYDLSGNNIVQMDGVSGNVVFAEVYAGGMHLATYSEGTTTFHHQDWQGTERARTGMNGMLSQTCTGLIYGDSFACSGTESSYVHFTGYDHDYETGLEHSWFRYYNPRLGRFMTTDPLAGDIGNPQSLNRYAYVGNNPVNFFDPWGLEMCLAGTEGTCVDVVGAPDPIETIIICISCGVTTIPYVREIGGGGGSGVQGTVKTPTKIANALRCAAANASSIKSELG